MHFFSVIALILPFAHAEVAPECVPVVDRLLYIYDLGLYDRPTYNKVQVGTKRAEGPEIRFSKTTTRSLEYRHTYVVSRPLPEGKGREVIYDEYGVGRKYDQPKAGSQPDFSKLPKDSQVKVTVDRNCHVTQIELPGAGLKASAQTCRGLIAGLKGKSLDPYLYDEPGIMIAGLVPNRSVGVEFKAGTRMTPGVHGRANSKMVKVCDRWRQFLPDQAQSSGPANSPRSGGFSAGSLEGN